MHSKVLKPGAPKHERAELFIYVRLCLNTKKRMWWSPLGPFLVLVGLSVFPDFSLAWSVSLLFSGCGDASFLRLHGADLCYGTAKCDCGQEGTSWSKSLPHVVVAYQVVSSWPGQI
jgi:hypothetical protein